MKVEYVKKRPPQAKNRRRQGVRGLAPGSGLLDQPSTALNPPNHAPIHDSNHRPHVTTLSYEPSS